MKKIMILAALVCGLCSCGGVSLNKADIENVQALSDIVQSYGPRGSLRARAGRPVIAGIINGVILVPGFEIDAEVDADSKKIKE